MSGALIVCEGIDGSGKTTASRGIVEALRARGVRARWTCEPTATWLGEAVRRGFREGAPALSEAFLFMADHAAHVERVRGWLAEGEVVVSDRWSESTFAYQGAALGGALAVEDPVAWLRQVEAPWDLAPDLLLLFDLPVDVALARVGARGKQLEKFERGEFLERVRDNYLRLAQEGPRHVRVDASGSPDAVLAEAVRACLGALGLNASKE